MGVPMKRVRTFSNRVSLRPVIELSPGDLGQNEDSDWRHGLALSGLGDASTVVPGSWLVYAYEIVEPRALRAVLNAHLGLPGSEGAATPLSPAALQGGFA